MSHLSKEANAKQRYLKRCITGIDEKFNALLCSTVVIKPHLLQERTVIEITNDSCA